MADILTIEPDEGVEQIQARLARARSRQVYLYLPKPNPKLRRRLSLTLLQRTADDLGLDLTIVTHDGAIRVMAGNVGLSVRWRLDGVESGERKEENGKGKGERGKGEGEKGKRGKTPTSILQSPTSNLQSPISNLQPPISILHLPLSVVALAVILLVLGLALAALILPHATVIVTPQTTLFETTIDVQANPSLTSVDVPGRRIPARRLEVMLERQAREPTSVQREMPDAPAQGTVVFVNQSERAIRIPAGSIVSTNGGLGTQFRTLEVVTLPEPAGTTAQTQVEAVVPGPTGNVPAYAIDTLDPSLGLPVAVRNNEPTNGGAVRRAGVITQKVRDQARDTLYESMRLEALQALGAQLHENERLVDDTIDVRIVDETFSEPPDAIADAVTVDLTVQAVGTAIEVDQARKLAEAILRKQVPADQRLIDASLSTDVGPLSGLADGAVRVPITVEAETRASINKFDIKNEVRGQPVDKAVNVLRERFPLATTPDIEVTRGWLGRIPWLSARIDVVIR